MEVRRITISIAGRNYPLNVPAAEEETLRKVGKQIEVMIKDFEQNFDVRDKQDALGTNAEVSVITNEKNIHASNERLMKINQLLEELEK